MSQMQQLFLSAYGKEKHLLFDKVWQRRPPAGI
jgi:hypothetical protein